jgi:hypothetical protein
MNVQLCIREDNGCYIGETTAICIKTNIAELKNEPVLFYGSTKDCVIDQVITVLRSRKLSGKIQLI